MDGPRSLDNLESRKDEVKRALRATLIASMDELGGRVEDSMRERLNDAFPPPSAAGDSPHRRSGALSGGVVHDNSSDAVSVTTEITVQRSGSNDIPNWLEGGTSRMAARPFVRPTMDEWTPQILPAAESIIKEKFTL